MAVIAARLFIRKSPHDVKIKHIRRQLKVFESQAYGRTGMTRKAKDAPAPRTSSTT
jgi:hypothetical protein